MPTITKTPISVTKFSDDNSPEFDMTNLSLPTPFP